MERSDLYEILSTEYANWEIDPKPLGNGSYGVVFKMTNRTNGELRALKAITIPHDDSDIDKRRGSGYTEEEIKRDYTAIKDRVLDEIVNVIQLRGNENVVRIHGYREIRQKDQIGWIVCFDMEYLPTMKEILPMTEQEVRKLGLDICNALKDCHEKGIIHRDIKPQNILKRGGTNVLVDFGESKMIKSQSSLSMRGTYDYMAPELLRQQKYPYVAPGTVDIYSLGITLYLFANHNRLPFLNSIKEMMNSDARDEANIRRWNSPILPRPSGVSERLGNVILCATQPDPRRRYQSAADMEHDLQIVDTNDSLICDRINPLALASANSAQAYPPAQKMNNAPVTPVQHTPLQPVQNTPTKPVQNVPVTPVQNTPVQPFQSASAKPASLEAPKKKKTGLIIGIAAGVVAVALAVVGVVFFLNGNSSKSGSDGKSSGKTESNEKTSGEVETIDAPNAKLDEELYGPTVEHYYSALLARNPSSDEKEKAFKDIRKSNGGTECVIRDLVKSSEFKGSNLSDRDYMQAVHLAMVWADAPDTVASDYLYIIQSQSRDAFVDYLVETNWPGDHVVVDITRKNIIGDYEYYIGNKVNTSMQYMLTTYIYDADTGKALTFNGNDYLGRATVTANQRTSGPAVPELPEGKYRLVIKKEPYGTVVYDEGFEVN